MTSPSTPSERAGWLDPLAWCDVDRALAFVGVALVFRVANALAASRSHLDDGRPSFLDHATLSRAVPLLWGLVVWWLGIAAAGLWLRARRPSSNAYVLVVLTSFWMTNAGVSIAIGTFHSPFWIVLPGASVAMMVLFGWRRTFGTLLPALALIAGATAAVAGGSLRYAPLFARPPYDAAGRPEAGWVASIGGASIAATLVTVVAAQLLLARLRSREAELQRLTRTDALTAVGNRRAFFERLLHELAMRARRGSALSVVAVDVDHFKQINDRHGHPAGDAALVAVAAALVAAGRQTDFVARIGGEEFALVLPDTGAVGARVVAERCRAAIERLTVTSPSGAPIPTTATFGTATTLDGGADAAESLLQAADAALYRGKQAGRNRVVAATDDLTAAT